MSLERSPFDQPSFVNPWSLRVFAITVAAAERGLFSLHDFQCALIARIRHFEAGGQCIDSDESYYTRWVEALTDLLDARRIVIGAQLAPAEQAVREAVAALREAQQHDHHHNHHHGHTASDHDHVNQAHVANTGARDVCRRPQPVFVEAAR